MNKISKTICYQFVFRFLIVILSFSLFSCEPENGDEEPEITRDKFIGIWTCLESSQITYSVNIKKSPNDSNEIYLYHFHFLGENNYAKAGVTGSSLRLPRQTLCDGTKVSGNALMGASKRNISFTYTLETSESIDTINATYSK